MVGVQGVGGVPEPGKSDRSTAAKNNANAPVSGDSEGSSDNVAISSEAQAAAKIAASLKSIEGQPDIRADRVAEAKAAIERGDYKKPEIVASVAEQVAKHL